MADEARPEARRRIAAVTAAHRPTHSGGNCLCGWISGGNPQDEHVADAVMDLFLNADWRGSLNGSTGIRARQLVLHGPVEPVTEEPTP